MEGDHDTIATHVRIRLEIAIAQRDGRAERLERVLRRFARATAVRDRDRAGPVEERVKAMTTRAQAHSMNSSLPPRRRTLATA